MTRLLSPSVLSWLRCFDATARHGSFTRAAQDLYVTQGAVSQQVKQLEQWLGKPLLLRTPRALVLTPEGKWLSVVLRESLQTLENVLDELRKVADEQPVVMSSTPSFTMTWLTPRLGSFFRQHPQIGLRIQAEFHALDRAGMQREGLDAAVRFDLGEYADLYASAFLDEWLVPVASPAFLAEHPQLRAPQDLSGAMLLHDFSPWYWAAAQQEWAHWFQQMRLPVPADFPSGRTYNLAMLAQSAAVTGQGVALGHVAHVFDDISAGRLVPLFGCRVRSQASYFFITPPSRDSRLLQVEQWLQAQAEAFRAQRQPLLDTLAPARE